MTFEELLQAARDHRSIIGFHSHATVRPMPAAFIIGMPLQLIARRIYNMKLYVKKKGREK